MTKKVAPINKLFFAVTASLIFTTGCSQTENSKCFVNKDCEKDLVCCVTDLVNEQGVCKPEAECTVDSGTPDSNTNDGNTDSQ